MIASPGAGDRELRRDIDALVAKISRRWPALRFLVHSAGILSGRPTLTRDGVEMNFAVNYLSRFALTLGLLPALRRASESSRLSGVLLVSGAASSGRVQFDDVNLTRNFSTIRAVSQYCRANDLFTDELARRLAGEPNPEKVIVSCLKFGPVKGTNIRHGFPWWMKLVVPLLLDPLIAQAPEQAADAAWKYSWVVPANCPMARYSKRSPSCAVSKSLALQRSAARPRSFGISASDCSARLP
jgi:NAD(P)-dependent dehydrogenase (short-subunit alcohol dehydrogenase family)